MKIEEIKNIEGVEITEAEGIEASIDKVEIGNKGIIKKIDSQENLEKNPFMLIRKQEKNQKTKRYLSNG